MHLSRDHFGSWLDRYIEAWRSRDPAAIGALFSADCAYSYLGGHTPVAGRGAIVAAWLEDDDVHVAIGSTRYLDEAGAVDVEYSNIFVCRFDEAGQCREFSEWFLRAPGPVGRLD